MRILVVVASVLLLILLVCDSADANILKKRRRRKGVEKSSTETSEINDPDEELPPRRGRGRRRRQQRMTLQGQHRKRKASSLLVGANTTESRNQTLVWKCGSIKGGLFNHFLQIKYMNSVAQQYNRSLLIVPTTGRSSDKEREDYIDICEVFDFSEYNIRCSTELKEIPLKCFSKFEALDRFSSLTRFCFDGKIWSTLQGMVPSDQYLQLMDTSPRLHFKQKYLTLYENVFKTFQSSQTSINSFNSSQDSMFVVVDWRSGSYCKKKLAAPTILSDDKKLIIRRLRENPSQPHKSKNIRTNRRKNKRQLLKGSSTTSSSSHQRNNRRQLLREKKSSKAVSLSVSCQSAHILLHDVTTFLSTYFKPSQSISQRKSIQSTTSTTISNMIHTKTLPIFIATNSKNQSEIHLIESNNNQQSKTTSEFDPNFYLITSFFSKDILPLTIMEIYVLEVVFMLQSPVFVSYGAHVSSDIIEYERMRQGKSFCIRNEFFTSTNPSFKQVPWCQLYKNSLLTAAALQKEINKTALSSSSHAISNTKKKSWMSLLSLFGRK